MSYPSCPHGHNDPNFNCPQCERDDELASLRAQLSDARTERDEARNEASNNLWSEWEVERAGKLAELELAKINNSKLTSDLSAANAQIARMREALEKVRDFPEPPPHFTEEAIQACYKIALSQCRKEAKAALTATGKDGGRALNDRIDRVINTTAFQAALDADGVPLFEFQCSWGLAKGDFSKLPPGYQRAILAGEKELNREG